MIKIQHVFQNLGCIDVLNNLDVHKRCGTHAYHLARRVFILFFKQTVDYLQVHDDIPGRVQEKTARDNIPLGCRTAVTQQGHSRDIVTVVRSCRSTPQLL